MAEKKLLINNKKLVNEWNYEKNNVLGLNIENITEESGIKVNWKCAFNHEWQARICDRVNGNDCPYCAGKKVLIGFNDLATTNPNLLDEWDYARNKELSIFPTEVTKGSRKKVWWKCNKCNNSWEAIIYNRATLGSGCIYCTNQKAIKGKNDLKTLYPNLIKEWDYEKNEGLMPENYKPKSNIKIWWKCELGHSWKCSINHRTNGTNCPKCFKEYGTSFAEQAIYYYLSKYANVENRIKISNQEVDIFLPDYKIGFEYDGKYYHNGNKNEIKEKRKNEELKNNNITLYRIKEADKFELDLENKIIYCLPDRDYNYLKEVLYQIGKILKIDIGKININDDRLTIYSQYVKFIKEHSIIVNENKKLLTEWNYEKNKGLLPENFSVNSNVKVWWKCSVCHSDYIATISHRTNGTGCPFCDGKLVNETNNLKNKFPELSKTWDYEKNNPLKPEDVYYSSKKKVWWKCPTCSKKFFASICTRITTKDFDCSECMHKRIGLTNQLISVKKKGSLITTNPNLAKEWNYERNNGLTPDSFSNGSGKRVWWKCSKCGYEWEAVICNRKNGTGCPNCYKLNRSKDEK